MTHIEGKEGEAAALGGGSRFTKYKRNSFQAETILFLPTCPNRSAPLYLDVKQSLEIWLKMVDDNHCTKSKGKYPASALLVKSFKLQRI